VEVNCASIPETLLESELFGYEKGAFTDARERKLGLFEIARTGTIFLDEIGEMPLKLQAKLLRVLEYRRFKRLGGTKDVEFTGRIVAATNRDLLREVAEQRFRADLYYRLNVLPVVVPALKERAADIPTLAEFFCAKLAAELDLPRPKLAREALEVLTAHDWPGNIRELRNVLQRALVYHEPRVLTAEHLEIDVWPMLDGARPDEAAAAPAAGARTERHIALVPARQEIPVEASGAAGRVPAGFELPASGLNLETLERSLLMQALERARNNQTKAAELLGISRHTLRYRLEKHGLVGAE
jgi:DNA-binding NtrC family response regulator